jgi:hypothetical protein
VKASTVLFLSCALTAYAVPAVARLSEARAVAIAQEACVGKNHSDEKPKVELKYGWWGVTWAPAEGASDYPVGFVDDKTGEPKGCPYFSNKPYAGPIPPDEKRN